MNPPFLSSGNRVERRITLSAEDIVRGASELDDRNPLHHDAALAARSRFGGLIASGAHTVGLLLGLAGSQAVERPGVGLSFSFDLKSAAAVGEELVIWWEIERTEPTANGTHTLALMRGGITTSDGRVVLEARGTTLQFGTK